MTQRRIGLTGGIATGKSTVGRLLEESFGLPVLDADRYAREALAAGSPGAAAVAARYGASVAGGEPVRVDRAALGRIVFTDAGERAWLEELVHPIVRVRFGQELQRLAGAPVVVLMIPLLFEAGLESLCSESWLVDCQEHEQLRRLMARDGLNQEEAGARIGSQWPLARKRPLATVVLDNRGGPEQLVRQVERALRGGAAPAAPSPPPA